MKTSQDWLHIGILAAAGAAFAACGGAKSGGNQNLGGGSGSDNGGAGGSGFTGVPDPPAPPRPAIGHQIDRAGRDGINLAVTDPWGLMEVFSFQDRDVYNRAADRSQWPMLFGSRMEFSLGIWDGVDGTCGNQIDAGPTVAAGRY